MDTRPERKSSIPDGQHYAGFERIGPGTLAGRYLRRFWQPIALARELRPRCALPLNVLGEEFALYRGESGRAQVLQSRCPHRGTRLSAGWVEGDSLRCFYHGWKFDSSGQCIEQPAEQRDLAKKVCIASYPTTEYLGLVFAFFGGGEPPGLPRLSLFDEAPYLDSARAYRGCSFFNQMENSVDEVHINFVHRTSSFADAGYTRHIPEVVARETGYGIERTARRGGECRIGHFLMPNTLLTTVPDPQNGWTQHISWRVPVDDDSHISFMVDAISLESTALEAYRRRRELELALLARLPSAEELARQVLRGERSLDELHDRPDLLTIQDTVALVGQAGADRSRDLLVGSDSSVALLRRIWARELELLNQGLPGKTWHWPPDVRVTVVTSAEYSTEREAL